MNIGVGRSRGGGGIYSYLRNSHIPNNWECIDFYVLTAFYLQQVAYEYTYIAWVMENSNF